MALPPILTWMSEFDIFIPNVYAVQGSIARMLWCLVRHSFCLEARRCLLSKLSDVLLTKYPLCVVSQPSVLVSHWWTWRLCPVLAALTDCPYLATAHCSSHQTLPSPPLYTILPLLLGTFKVTFAIQLELYVYMYTCRLMPVKSVKKIKNIFSSLFYQIWWYVGGWASGAPCV